MSSFHSWGYHTVWLYVLYVTVHCISSQICQLITYGYIFFPSPSLPLFHFFPPHLPFPSFDLVWVRMYDICLQCISGLWLYAFWLHILYLFFLFCYLENPINIKKMLSCSWLFLHCCIMCSLLILNESDRNWQAFLHQQEQKQPRCTTGQFNLPVKKWWKSICWC